MSGAAPRDVLIVTCSEPDALPFLLSLPRATREQTALVATGDVVRSAEQQTPTAAAHVSGGLASLNEVRHLLDGPHRRVTVVVAPDPWGPFHGKGFMRARLLTPWTLAPDARVDLIELQKGGRAGRMLSGLSRGALLRRLYAREALLLSEYLVHAGVGRPAGPFVTLLRLPRALFSAALALPLAAATLARLIPFILWTEARATLMARQR